MISVRRLTEMVEAKEANKLCIYTVAKDTRGAKEGKQAKEVVCPQWNLNGYGILRESVK